MSQPYPTARLFRSRDGEARVSFVELFFDLVFVFAITQISHTLVKHLDPAGFAQAVIVLVAVWWVWIYTAWITNWTDPERGAIRAMLIVLMLVGLVLSTSIPEAFADRGMIFAVAYLVMQLGRSAFVYLIYLRSGMPGAVNILRILLWAVIAAPFWIAGAVVGGGWQLALWGLALALELLAPTIQYRIPGLGRPAPTDWAVSGEHMSERAGLFIIIALGESILVTGVAFSEGDATAGAISGFGAAFIGTISMWLLYFSHAEAGGRRYILRAELSGLVARLSYTYLHIPIVAGIILVAVGDELVLEHPDGAVEPVAAGAITGGAAVYLLGLMLFKRSVGAPWLWSHVAGIAVAAGLYALVVVAHPEWLSSAGLSWAINGMLVAVWLIDERMVRRGRSSLEAFDAEHV